MKSKSFAIKTLFILSLSLTITIPAQSFKPAKPKNVQTTYSKDKLIKVKIKPVNWKGTVTVSYKKRRFDWNHTVNLPDETVAANKKIILLGGYGAPGLALGKIKIYSLSGKLLKSIDLKKVIPNLKKLSEAYREICCPFPWVHRVSVKADTDLIVNVCNKVNVRISLKSYKIIVMNL